MGRELRRVPKNWEHPKKEDKPDSYQPMFNESYINAITEWIESHKLWEEGKHPSQYSSCKYYAEYAGCGPDVEYHRPNWKEDEMTWFQVYETVSEGTPVSPSFETGEELVEYLVKHGDFWDQSRREDQSLNPSRFDMPCDPWSRKAAESFVFGSGWAPSGIIINGKYMSGVEGIAD